VLYFRLYAKKQSKLIRLRGQGICRDVNAQANRAFQRIGNYGDLVRGRKSDDAGGGRWIALTVSA
jgi:hypothetical protein